MGNKKVAIITGITGQDGSHLADQLLEKDYKVYGVKRRTSSNSLGHAAHLEKDVEIWEGDITDLSSIAKLCKEASADEFYHLAAQSHVGLSFKEPVSTLSINAGGTLNCLEAIRLSGIHTKFYHAATSEMFGGIKGISPQSETTPFYPKSPYGAAKLAGYWLTVNYRESYKIFACNGILFNHECFFADTPLILKYGNDIKIEYISDLIQNRADVSKDSNIKEKDYTNYNIEVWDGLNFVKLKTISRKKLSSVDKNKMRRFDINTRSGVTSTTFNHNFLINNNSDNKAGDGCILTGKVWCTKIKAEDILKDKTKLMTGNYPIIQSNKDVTNTFAEFIGLLVGDGYISERGNIKFTNNNVKIQNRFIELAKKLYVNCNYKKSEYISGFKGKTTQINLTGVSCIEGKKIKSIIYHERTSHKKIPDIILNANKKIQEYFLKGYNAADGLKKGRETYEFASFKTNSPILAQGLLFLINNVTGQTFNINVFEQNDKKYFQCNLHSSDNKNQSGKHLKKDPFVVKKEIITNDVDNQHVFDIETESGHVMAGVGIHIVGNSPRRGDNFVTRKISKAVAMISNGLQDKLYLGNLEAKRDWGDAEDYVAGMHMMLQHNKPDDYVLATGETHTIREFCDIAFNLVGLDYRDYVEIDPRFYRPAEVDVLLGDSSKARKILGWEPKITFKQLVEKMVDHDLKLIEG